MSYDYAKQRGFIVPFTGNLVITRNDEGKIFRSDDTSNVTVTVPNDLHDGFNIGFMTYSTGTITLVPGPHVINRSGKTALLSQYLAGSLMVTKRSGGDGVFGDIEFLVGGDFA
ncbi:hypothetical protein IVA96_23870 [Bradyrhizobium sp. 159]|uniref:hypothetical protein n=1 Tax=Bradyrhizobium sp. 159 TaxID=2782632 RepID=UPI001FF9C955|nr:hypothetical protein [Bradyrhizobium sp. 159]MCK1619557.1 hypothetical protein [Bradyrhizobium sp. 159]